MTDYEDLKKAPPEVKQEKVRELVQQVQHMINIWQWKEEGWNIYYAHSHREYSAKIRDFLSTCPDSKEKAEVFTLMDKLDKIHADFVERMSNH